MLSGSEGVGTIPFREHPLNYQYVKPLLDYDNRQWNCWYPYTVDMQWCNLNGDLHYTPNPSSYGPACLSTMTVCFALLMDYHGIRYPDPDFWKRQPASKTTTESSELTRFLRELSDDLGYSVGTSPYHHSSRLFDVIPTVLRNKYKFYNTSAQEYFPDQAGFDKIRNHLYYYGPVIFQPKIKSSGNYMTSTHIVDGVIEIHTKIETKKYFLDFYLGKTTKWYYMDYFHYVSGVGRSYDQWDLYDTKVSIYSDIKAYLFLPTKP